MTRPLHPQDAKTITTWRNIVKNGESNEVFELMLDCFLLESSVLRHAAANNITWEGPVQAPKVPVSYICEFQGILAQKRAAATAPPAAGPPDDTPPAAKPQSKRAWECSAAKRKHEERDCPANIRT